MAIQVEQRVTPLRAFPAIVADVLSQNQHFVPVHTNAGQRFLTDEGEVAAATVVTGTDRGRGVTHVIAAVFAEDFYNVFDGRVTDSDGVAAMKQTVHELATRHRLHLGHRRRRFYFRPIDDWHVVRGLYLDVAMFPIEYPRRVSVIQVWAAIPVGAEGTALAIEEIDRQDRDAGLVLEPGQPLGASPIRTPLLAGHEWRRRLAGPGGLQFVRQFVELRDARYIYRLRLDGNEHDELGRHRELFKQVIGSVEPIAAVRTTVATADLSLVLGVD